MNDSKIPFNPPTCIRPLDSQVGRLPRQTPIALRAGTVGVCQGNAILDPFSCATGPWPEQGQTMHYIIRKASRSDLAPYAGSSCERAGVTPGRTYPSRTEAESDAQKLRQWNPVGFDVVERPDIRDLQPHPDPLHVGDRVMRSDVTDTSIPAYRDMRGTIVEMGVAGAYLPLGMAMVRWDCDQIPDVPSNLRTSRVYWLIRAVEPDPNTLDLPEPLVEDCDCGSCPTHNGGGSLDDKKSEQSA